MIMENMSKIEAVCKAGHYGTVGELCVKCPMGALCETDDLETPVAKQGFWGFMAKSSDENWEACPISMRATRDGKCPYFAACEPREACTGFNNCSQPYAGTRCAECAPQYFKLSGVCTPCPDCPVCVVLLFLLFAACLGGGGFVLHRKRIELGVISIGVDYFQVISILAMSNQIQWPDKLKNLFAVLSIFNLNLDLMAPECSYPDMPYEAKWAAIMSIPLIAFSCFACAHLAKYCHKKFVLHRTKKLHNHGHLVIGSSLMAFYFCYLYITKTTLDIFNCSPTDPPDGPEDDRYTYLVSFEWNSFAALTHF
jgi:hypothetical protein